MTGLETVVTVGVGAIVAIAAPPLFLGYLGFGASGIAAGSVAASLHSMAATTGVGMGLISAGQSAAAAGLAMSTSAMLATAGATAGYVASKVSD